MRLLGIAAGLKVELGLCHQEITALGPFEADIRSDVIYLLCFLSI